VSVQDYLLNLTSFYAHKIHLIAYITLLSCMFVTAYTCALNKSCIIEPYFLDVII